MNTRPARGIPRLVLLSSAFLSLAVGAAPSQRSALAQPQPTPQSESTGSSESLGAPVVGDIVLPDVWGKRHRLASQGDSIVVVAFLGAECPLAKLYGPRLERLRQKYAAKRVSFFAVNSNRQDSLAEVAAYARVHKLSFPVLKDAGNKLADQFDARRTPEVFLLDQKRRVRYRGRIDDQYGVGFARDKPEREDLRIAIDELLAGKPVSTPRTEAVGCHIGRVAQANESSAVTYSNQIVRILQKHCVECHRPGEIGPFSLLDYDEIAGWAETIDEVVQDGRMPPWHASPKYGHFVNERFMSDEEKRLIAEWVKQGGAAGDPKQLPAPREFEAGWRIPSKPDRIVDMRERPFRVPAEGTVEYQYFIVDPGFKEDKWISAAEVIPGNRSVVHHALVFIRPPEVDKGVAGFGLLAGYVPGQSTMVLPAGQARRVPAGSKLIFQMHYTPTGSVQEDKSRIGLVFADEATVKEEIVTFIAINRDFEIPPGAANYQVEARLAGVPSGARLIAMGPHMHVRGKSFRFVFHREGEDPEILLDVPRYDFNWQHSYGLRQPLTFRKGDRIQCIAHFDNSEANLVNPDPTQEVRWGDQTWEEMCLALIEIAVPKGTRPQRRPLTDADREKAKRYAEQFIQRFDADRNRRVEQSETPPALSLFAFRQMDSNGDKSISFEEAYERALHSARRAR